MYNSSIYKLKFLSQFIIPMLFAGVNICYSQNSLYDLNIIFKHDFEKNTLGDYLSNEWAADWSNPTWSNRQSELDIVQDSQDKVNPTKTLQFNFPQGSVGPEEGGGQWWHHFEKQDEIYMSYDIMFMPGFQFQLGGKIPSLMGGELPTFSRPTGYDGFTGGLMFRDDSRIVFYVYYTDGSFEKGGTSFTWGGLNYPEGYFLPSSVQVPYGTNSTCKMNTGEWHNITFRMAVNTVGPYGGNYDGIMEAYFDGVLVTQLSHMLFRHTKDIGIDVLRMYSFFGGNDNSWRNPIEEWLRVDNVMVYQFKDNYNVPRGNTLSPQNRTIKYWRNFQDIVPLPVVKPFTPTGLFGTYVVDEGVNLQWNDNSDNETSFEIERAGTDGSRIIFNCKANSAAFTDNSAEGNENYTYRIRSANEAGYSEFSNSVAIYTTINTVYKYELPLLSSNCSASDIFSLPLVKNSIGQLNNCKGFDITLQYNRKKVLPTGIIKINHNLISDSAITDYNFVLNDSLIQISLFFYGENVDNSSFNGQGQVLSVEFFKTANFENNDSAYFHIKSVKERYNGNLVTCLGQSGMFKTFSDSIFDGSVRFWGNNLPVVVDSSYYPEYAQDIKVYGLGTIENIDTSAYAIADNNGNFEYPVNVSRKILIDRDIPSGTDMLPVINGIDAYYVKKVLTGDTAFVPSVYQLMAMDVNGDGIISAGDLTQINMRAVSIIDAFEQTTQGSLKSASDLGISNDWIFLPYKTISSGKNYRISGKYPNDDNVGYSKFRVPVVPAIVPLTVNDSSECMQVQNESYKGILLGDVTGNFKNYILKKNQKSASVHKIDTIVLKVTESSEYNDYLEINIDINSPGLLQSLDFSLEYNKNKLEYLMVDANKNQLEYTLNNNLPGKIQFTSFASGSYMDKNELLKLRFSVKNGIPEQNDFVLTKGYINGELCNTSVILDKILPEIEKVENIEIYPNPAGKYIVLKCEYLSNVRIVDITGKIVLSFSDKISGSTNINLQNLRPGTYFVVIRGDNFQTSKKLVLLP